ncbi:MAG TPA: cytochrome c [Candidatus Binatia bacterium]
MPYHLVRLSAKKSIIVAKVLFIMRKKSFWIFAFSALLLVLAGMDPTWAQNQSEGKKLYLTYCASCHGDNGKGDGPAAQSLPVKPANHTSGSVMNQFTDKFLMEIISKGGSAVGKSPMMPAWGGQFKEDQLRDIVAYVRSIADPPYKPSGK